MRTRLSFMFLVFLAASACAGTVRIPQLPEAEYADDEVSTNVVVTPLTGSRKFTVEISLCADWTNNVEVSVGCDRNPHDGELSTAEAAVSAGWNRGAWFFAAPGLTNVHESAINIAGSARTLFMQIDIRENNTIRNISLSEDGVPIFTNSMVAALPAECDWDLVKVTSRGITAASEAIAVKTNPHGLGIICR